MSNWVPLAFICVVLAAGGDAGHVEGQPMMDGGRVVRVVLPIWTGLVQPAAGGRH